MTVNTQKSDVMCFNSRSDDLPNLYYDGTPLSYINEIKYLGMLCDKSINLNTAADAALRPFTAGTFRLKILSKKTAFPTGCMLTSGFSNLMQFPLACMQVRFGPHLSYNGAERWTTPFRSGC
jgi:hypothetical protein